MFSILFLSVLRQNYEMVLSVSLDHGLGVTMPDINVLRDCFYPYVQQETQGQALST